jgi:hypothetical protein
MTLAASGRQIVITGPICGVGKNSRNGLFANNVLSSFPNLTHSSETFGAPIRPGFNARLLTIGVPATYRN